jgi:YD repeat-containing protein
MEINFGFCKGSFFRLALSLFLFVLALNTLNLRTMNTKIKSIRATRYDMVYSDTAEDHFEMVENPLSLKEYDQAGNLILEANWGPGGVFSDKYEYQYEEGARVKHFVYADEEEIGQTESYEYDAEGRLVKSITEYSDGSLDSTTHTYDASGHRIESVTVDEDGEIGQQEFWTYEGDLLTSYKLINDFGEVEEEELRKYDAEGRLTERHYKNISEETEYKVLYSYDNEGRLLLEQKLNMRDKPLEDINYEYDGQGNLIKETVENAYETIVRKRKYDEKGNEIETIELEETDEDEEDDIIRYEVAREYDPEGRIIFSKVLIHSTAERRGAVYEVKTEYTFWA